jgi:plasmid stabilization system protein ParE
MSFVVELSPAAEADLERLFDFLLDQADATEDLDRAQAAIDAIRATARHRLAITPFSFW